ncbi:hypothetical protein BGW36DRAFT_445203 [Talaromyces proteolyticus]|uniref:Uncharacterized protein n=1 Tax=Talaromyces proteolyticus TaxID=1131652 RepID=A0AAD4Q3C5_9EURO|nr:uncharacterized protein BGW36DRAFT_445203 [Talaromyces proteolyticus]KAH8701618.1 hypothetical protein BGW36DRAFT_445203 [Talaromyces proteolyticus]
MDEAVNVPLPPRTASPEANKSLLQYATSLHSFVDDDESLNLMNWAPEAEPQQRQSRQQLRQRSNSYDDIYDRSNAPSRGRKMYQRICKGLTVTGASHEKLILQDFPPPVGSPRVPSRTGAVDLGRTSRVEPINKILTNKLSSFELGQAPVQELRRKFAGSELPLLQQTNPNGDTSFDPKKSTYDLIAPH